MAGMFGNSRGFGGSLGASPLQRLAGGIGMGFGGERFPQVMVNQLMGGRGAPGMFGGGMGGGNEPSQAAMLNYASLEGMGQRQFAGNQAQLDRDLENNLLQQQLRNALQLQGMRGQNAIDLQGLVNSGALDQIGARGNIEQSLLGRRLSSEENQLAQQLGFNREALQANLGAQGLDRESRERMHGAGLSNALELQSRSDQSAFERLRAQLTGQETLQGQEIQGRNDLQRLMGGQAMEQLQERARAEAGLQRMRGQQSLGELREQAGYARANLMDQLGLQQQLGLGQQSTQRYLGELNAAGQLYDTQSRNELGWAGLGNQRYNSDLQYDLGLMRNDQDAYQFQADLNQRRRQGQEQMQFNRDRLNEDKRQYDNPQPLQVQPPPTRQALMDRAFTLAVQALPDGTPEEHEAYVDRYMGMVESPTSQPGQPGPARGRRALSPTQAIKQAQLADQMNHASGYELMRGIGPILNGLELMEDGTIGPETADALAQRGIDARVLGRMLEYHPYFEGPDASRDRYLSQRRAKLFRDALLKQQ